MLYSDKSPCSPISHTEMLHVHLRISVTYRCKYVYICCHMSLGWVGAVNLRNMHIDLYVHLRNLASVLMKIAGNLRDMTGNLQICFRSGIALRVLPDCIRSLKIYVINRPGPVPNTRNQFSQSLSITSATCRSTSRQRHVAQH